MTATTLTTSRAFAVWFKDLHRWDYGFFRSLAWAWPKEMLLPVGALLKRKIVEVSTTEDKTTLPIIEKISFGGQISVTDVASRKNYKGRLFWVDSGDLIYSKIRVKQGSLAIVPDECERLAVSAEYPVYNVDQDRVDPTFLMLVLKSKSFLSIFEGLSHGGSTKTRIPPIEFERQKIPLPPLTEQEAIVARWRKAQSDITAARERAEKLEAALPNIVYQGLGTPPPGADRATDKWLVMWWKDLERWSFNYLSRSRQGLLGYTKSKFPIEPLGTHLVGTMNGYCIKPVAGPTPHKMLKLNALAPAGLDLTASKFIIIPQKIADRFSVHKGDLFICRSVGSYDHVAKCAIAAADAPDTVFPDIMIRVRLRESLLPAFVGEVVQTPLGRSFFQSNARTAVGMWKIGAEDIANFPIPVPPLAVQKEIVERIAAQRREIARERETAERLSRDIDAEIEALILGSKRLN